MANPNKSQTLAEERDAQLRALIDARALYSPAELLEVVHVPTDIAAALSTGRPELLSLTRPRDMTAEEVGKLYHLIEVLIRTNAALAAHAREVGNMASALDGMLRGSVGYMRKLQQFAGFTVAGDGDEEEEA